MEFRSVLNVLVSAALLCTCILQVSSKIESDWKPAELWQELPGNTHLKISVFNVTNGDEFLSNPKAIKPFVEEIGPYVYRVQSKKIEAAQQFDDLSIKFRRQKYYEFESASSAAGLTEDDRFDIVNQQLLIYGTRMASLNSYMDGMYLGWLIDVEGEVLVRNNETLRDIMFGGMDSSVYVKYEKYIEELSSRATPAGFEEFEDGRYSYFKNKNGSDFGEQRLHYQPSEIQGQIISLDRKTELSYWNGSSCNEIPMSSTDGSSFASNPAAATLSVFLPELCRFVSLEFNETVEIDGITGQRFVLQKSFLNYSMEENRCFCTDPSGKCLRDGGLDIQSCALGAPYVISLPHFANADSNYTESVHGLSTPKDDENIYDTFYVVEPITGTVLESKKRFQLNIRIGALNKTTYFKNFPEFLFPIFWMEETYKLDESSMSILKSILDPPPTTLATAGPCTTITPTPTSPSQPTTTATAATSTTTHMPVPNKNQTDDSTSEDINRIHKDLRAIGQHMIYLIFATMLIFFVLLLLTLEMLRQLKYSRNVRLSKAMLIDNGNRKKPAILDNEEKPSKA